LPCPLIRSGGVWACQALAYNGTLALLGGTTPLVATWLIGATGFPLAPAFYLGGGVRAAGSGRLLHAGTSPPTAALTHFVKKGARFALPFPFLAEGLPIGVALLHGNSEGGLQVSFPEAPGIFPSDRGQTMNATIREPFLTSQVFRQSPFFALRRLSLEETDGTVIIHGDVASYYLKQLAQETLRPLLAGRQLVNEVRVSPEIPFPAFAD